MTFQLEYTMTFAEDRSESIGRSWEGDYDTEAGALAAAQQAADENRSTVRVVELGPGRREIRLVAIVEPTAPVV